MIKLGVPVSGTPFAYKVKKMATTCYFEETVRDQNGKVEIELEIGRSSYYSGAKVKNGIGEDSIYIAIDGKNVIMDRVTAQKFVEAVASVGRYHGLID